MTPERAERARRSLVRQNVFARRIGLKLVTSFTLAVLLSLAVQAIYQLALFLVSSGALRPRSLAEP